jgi:hypothetical protein
VLTWRHTQAAKAALLAAIPNAKSDHLALVVAFDAWQRALDGGGRGAAAAFCAQHFISHQVPCSGATQVDPHFMGANPSAAET